MKQIWTEQEEEIEKYRIIVGDINNIAQKLIEQTETDRLDRKSGRVWANTIHQQALTDVYRPSNHQQNMYSFQMHGTFTKVDHILGH